MVEKLFNRFIYRIYNRTKNYLLNHNCLVDKSTFDFAFWGDL